MASCSLLIVPVITSILTIGFWHILGINGNSQGFSGIDAAFFAYILAGIVIWNLKGSLELFDHPEYFTGHKIRFYFSCGLLAFISAMIGIGGLELGLFLNVDGLNSNGIAHFGGFITGLIVLLLFDVITEKRKYFNATLVFAIIIGIFWYGNYLIKIINVVKGI
ncbi:MAG: hypothetical protein ABR887_04465 [Methanoregulaceae archaeon]